MSETSDKSQVKVSDFKPQSLDSPKADIRAFKPRNLQSGAMPDYANVKKSFGSLASTDAGANGHFALYPESKKLLGVEAEERSHLENLVVKEVEERMAAIHQEAYAKGFEQGRLDGKTSAEAEFKTALQPAFEQFLNFLNQFEAIKKELYDANEEVLVRLIFHVSKIVLLRELKSDREYVQRLATQLIERVGAKEAVRIKINRVDSENMEQMRDFLKVQFPELRNIQFEAVEDLPLGGCRVETDMSRVNASVEVQLKFLEEALNGADGIQKGES